VSPKAPSQPYQTASARARCAKRVVTWYLKKWCYRAARSKLDPVKKFVKSVRKHEELILNYFKAKRALSSGIVEGLNRNVNLVTRKAYGFRTFDALETALYQTLGKLPEPKSTHEFF
jgi:transposase